MTKKRLFLIDGAALFYRSYFAFIRNPLINSKGENTSAPYGFVNAVIRLLTEEKPEYLSVVFDTPEPTFRHKIYPEYKATREKMPDEMRQQYPRIIEFLELMNIPMIEKVGYEADDLMGTIAVNEVNKDTEIFLMTGDKDFMQLIRPGVCMYSQGKGGAEPQIIGKDGVAEKFGCTPELVIEVLGLMGDSSDNVPGVPKVGPKTAQNLIQEYGSIQGLYNNVDDLKPSKVKENLIQFKEQAYLSRELVTIDTEVAFDYDLQNFTIDQVHLENAEPWFKEMEFNSLLRRLKELDITKSELPRTTVMDTKNDYILVNSEAGIDEMLDELSKYKELAFDTETTGLSIQDDRLIGASFSVTPGKAWYVDLDSNRMEAEKEDLFINVKRDLLINKLKAVLENEHMGKIAQNAKFDIQVLLKEGIAVYPISFDTMLAAYLLDSNDEHNMDHLADRYLNYKTITFKELIAGDKNITDPSQVDIAKLKDYAAEDADVTLQLSRILKPQINDNEMKDLLYKMEIPLSIVLAKMESSGVKLDTQMLDDYSRQLEIELNVLISELYKEAGKEFNLNSPTQLGPILFEEMEVHKTLGMKRIPGFRVRVLTLHK